MVEIQLSRAVKFGFSALSRGLEAFLELLIGSEFASVSLKCFLTLSHDRKIVFSVVERVEVCLRY